MKSLSESIVHHIKYYTQLFPDDNKGRDFKPLKYNLSLHRMTVMNLSTFLLQFLESLVPFEMVRVLFHISWYIVENNIIKRKKKRFVGYFTSQSINQSINQSIIP